MYNHAHMSAAQVESGQKVTSGQISLPSATPATRRVTPHVHGHVHPDNAPQSTPIHSPNQCAVAKTPKPLTSRQPRYSLTYFAGSPTRRSKRSQVDTRRSAATAVQVADIGGMAYQPNVFSRCGPCAPLAWRPNWNIGNALTGCGDVPGRAAGFCHDLTRGR